MGKTSPSHKYKVELGKRELPVAEGRSAGVASDGGRNVVAIDSPAGASEANSCWWLWGNAPVPSKHNATSSVPEWRHGSDGGRKDLDAISD